MFGPLAALLGVAVAHFPRHPRDHGGCGDAVTGFGDGFGDRPPRVPSGIVDPHPVGPAHVVVAFRELFEGRGPHSDLGCLQVHASDRAWAAVGIVSQPKMIMLICSRSLGAALTAFVARRKGEDKRRDFLSVFKQSLILNFIVYSILLTLVLLFNKNILLFAGAKTEYIELAQTYFKYIAIGIFFRSMGIMISSAKVGLGKTKEVFYANVVGNVVNVILNYFLIFGNFGFPMLGIKGAAIATMIGDISTFLILLAGVINPENELNLSKEGSWKMEKHIMSPILNITSGTLAEQVFERIGLFLFSRIIAELGTVATGTNYVAMILCDLCYYTAIGMGVASSAFTGQKLGEKRPDLAKIYGKVASNVGYICTRARKARTPL